MRNKEKVMKKFLIGCATAAMMLSPAIAEAGGRHGHGNNWIAPVIFGTVLGVIISNNSHGHTVRHHRHVRRDVARHHRRNHRRHRWVEICKTWPRTIQDYYGDYYTEMVYDCRVVQKARW
jgi:hypothetical protein